MADPIVPILPPTDGKGEVWYLSDIYVGPNGNPRQRYVPRVGEFVVDPTVGWQLVVHVDDTTNLSSLRSWSPPSSEGGVLDEDVLLGSGPGSQSESFRVFHNPSVLPFTGRFDGRLHMYARDANHLILFRGTDVGPNGVRVSAIYDQNNQIVSNKIPLVALTQPTPGTPHVIKVPGEFNMTQQFADGDVVTAVTYGNEGQPISTAKLLIKNTEIIQHSGNSTRYITSIHLDSQWMSGSEPDLIEIPTNVPTQSAMFMGVVTYSDGSTASYPVDGGKFELMGIDQFISSTLGQQASVVLKYNLSQEENAALVSENPLGRFITRTYTIETVAGRDSYNVKLYGYPEWSAALGRYEMRFFLNNLTREEIWDVTDNVALHVTSPAFNGTAYGTEQNLIFVCQLGQVSPIFSSFRHVQTLGITLMNPGTVVGQKWRVRYSQGGAPFGIDVVATSSPGSGGGQRIFDVSSGFTSREDWTAALYERTEPVRNPASEPVPPEPTHFTVVAGSARVTREINEWDQPFPMASGNIAQGKDIFLEFERRTGNATLRLSVAAMPVDVTN